MMVAFEDVRAALEGNLFAIMVRESIDIHYRKILGALENKNKTNEDNVGARDDSLHFD